MSESWVIPQLARRFVFEEWGGTESVIWETTRRLQQRGLQTEILATRALSQRNFESRAGLNIRRFAHHYPYFGLDAESIRQLDKKGGNPFVPELEAYLKALPRLDLIHCHGMQRIAGLARRVARQRNIPYVISFHGGHFELPAAEIERMRAAVEGRFHYGRLLDPLYGTSRALDDADGLICVGYGEYLRCREAFGPERVLYAPNGVDPARFARAQGQRFRAAMGLEQQRLLLCVARIDPQKNQLALIELLARLPEDVSLVLIGPITDAAYANELQQATAAAGLHDRVRLLEGLAADDPLLADAYDAADLFMLPSRHEPFGIVVLEAWMRSKPVLVADVGGLRHLVRTEVDGLRFGTAAELLQLTLRLLEQPAYAARLGAAGREQALTHFSWDTLLNRQQAFYRQLITRRAGKFRQPPRVRLTA